MKRRILAAIIISIFIGKTSVFAQPTNAPSKNDLTSLEGIIIEKYYESTKEDSKDTIGGILPEGSITYRIYVEMKPGYHLQAIYGVPGHEFYFKTTTTFFNAKDGGESADKIIDKNINNNKVALDSWVTIGMATKTRYGVLKAEDKDGSIITRKTLDKTDGLMPVANASKLLYFGLDLSFFNDINNASYYHSDNGSIATVGGGKGVTAANKVLIAQLTTNGKLSFQLNVQIGTPSGAVMQFVAKDPMGTEILFKKLTH
ncbi:MAG: hypothetical protein ABI448_00840 [Bacteroidia bacterium]